MHYFIYFKNGTMENFEAKTFKFTALLWMLFDSKEPVARAECYICVATSNN